MDNLLSKKDVDGLTTFLMNFELTGSHEERVEQAERVANIALFGTEHDPYAATDELFYRIFLKNPDTFRDVIKKKSAQDRATLYKILVDVLVLNKCGNKGCQH